MADSKSNESSTPVRRSRTTPEAVSPGEAFDLLASQRRRYVLDCLRERGAPMTLAGLADEVAARERDVSVPDVPAEEGERVHVSLYHSHVPKLANAGVVEYDRERDTVTLSAAREHVEPYLELVA
ncbi:DUF7344 domain-containing protein [Halorarum salinum]|uniref:DUF7344 domain-containing protein n=1 Tax=Halorarum salinum TaxID=2743089 RepID=A0A7D5LCK6_9EURY|nr:hypothetical protein [Halobaculum salinum]QLG63374.1 hypothetical protein HUG12_17190 [Halobaculum salinum]